MNNDNHLSINSTQQPDIFSSISQDLSSWLEVILFGWYVPWIRGEKYAQCLSM